MTNKPNRRIVGPRGGKWVVQKPGSSRVSSQHDTQAAAINKARQILTNSGGGELTIQGANGRFRDSDTVKPGNDPFPPKDKK